ncbi:MAG: hypothetical protein Q9M94_00160 [Candidatus Gracilibacteria bacterium]|nr:hypothetical protein [Candidatus Gracilibacteria bacterium]
MYKTFFHKLVKTIFIIYLFIFFGFINNSYAEGTCESGCKIKSATPDILLEYISNNKKIIQNISKNLGKAPSQIDIPTNINISGTNINTNNSFSTGIGLRIYNSLFNWKETESGFKYFLANIDGDVPVPISRDLRLIDNQNRSLNYFLSKIIKNGYSFNDIDTEKVCEGIEDNGKCLKFLGNNIEDAIKNLINNNSTINLILRKELGFMGFQSIVGSSSYEELFLIPENFKQEIKKNYNKETYKSCAECSGGSIDIVKKTINKIILNDSQGKDGISEWISAWNLLLGIDNDDKKTDNNIERNLLNKELSRQGISSNNGTAVLKDLKDFKGNSFGFSIGNNPISNSFLNFIEEIEEPFKSKTVNNFTETISNISNSLPDKETFSLSEIKYTEKNLGNDSEVYKKIKETIKKNQAIIARQNKNTDKLQGRIIQLHINLTQTINTLEKIIPKAEKICNDQDNGNGICSYR